jgi:hypothetical protein
LVELPFFAGAIAAVEMSNVLWLVKWSWMELVIEKV